MATSTSRPRRLYFICLPRCGSTAILKCMSLSFVDERVEAWFEPFVIARIARIAYEMNTGKELSTEWSEEHAADFDKAADLVHAWHELDKLPKIEGKAYAYSEIKRSIDASTAPITIVKDMATSFYNMTQYLPSPDSGFRFVFLIRHPSLTIPSYKRGSLGFFIRSGTFQKEDFDLYKHDPKFKKSENPYKSIHSVLEHVRGSLDPDPLVIETEDFLADPKPYLRKICEVGGLEYRDSLLEWDPSPDVIMTWKNPGGIPKILQESLGDFHLTAIHSGGFIKQTTRKQPPPFDSLDEDVKKAVSIGMEYYEDLHKNRFIPQQTD